MSVSTIFSFCVFIFTLFSLLDSPQDILQFTLFDWISLQPARNIMEITLHSLQQNKVSR